MKDFINRIKDDWEYDSLYEREPLFFRVFLWFVLFVGVIGKAFFCVIAFITVPLWIIPYTIYWCLKHKKEGAEE